MGGEAKVTVMVLKVDLQCDKCYKKVKKVLCKFPQIRDQVYDEKANTVTVKVVCCSPEKIRDKMCSKGGGSIKSIEIKDPPKPKEPEKKPDKPKEGDKKPDKAKDPEKKPDKPKDADKKPDKPKDADKKPDKPKDPEKKSEKPKEEKPKEGEKKADKPKEGGDKPKDAPKQAAEAPKKQPEPAPGPVAAAAMAAVPSAYAVPVGCSCSDCYHSYGGGGQCFQAYGTPVTYGRPVYDSWGSGGYYQNQYRAPYGGGGEYVTDENPQGGCSIM